MCCNIHSTSWGKELLWCFLTGQGGKIVCFMTLFILACFPVHEANLEEDEVTFSGLPFVLRLRYIMEYASNSAKAR